MTTKQGKSLWSYEKLWSMAKKIQYLHQQGSA